MGNNRVESGRVERRSLVPRIAGVARAGGQKLETLSESDRIDSIARPLQSKLKALLRTPLGRAAKDFLNGTWLGHPLHPALTDIPVGAWTTAVTFDALTATRLARLDRAASACVALGIAGGIGAALAGIADWSDVNRDQRRVGLVHGSLNTVGLLLQIGSLVGRRRGLRGAKAMSALGLATSVMAAYLGGNLVYRMGTQVSQNAWLRGPRDFTPVMPEAELAPEQPTRKEVEGIPVVLVRHQGEIFALADTCGHAGCPLAEGRIEDGAIVCACHGSTFRLRDGAVLHGPAPFAQPSFEVRVVDGRIFIRSRAD